MRRDLSTRTKMSLVAVESYTVKLSHSTASDMQLRNTCLRRLRYNVRLTMHVLDVEERS